MLPYSAKNFSQSNYLGDKLKQVRSVVSLASSVLSTTNPKD